MFRSVVDIDADKLVVMPDEIGEKQLNVVQHQSMMDKLGKELIFEGFSFVFLKHQTIDPPTSTGIHP